MIETIEIMSDRYGFEDHIFKEEEGSPYDNVVVLKNSELRLYCLKFSKIILILGGGGVKPKNTRKYQEIPELHEAVKRLQFVSGIIDKAIRDRTIVYSGTVFKGQLKFNVEDYE